MSVDTDLVHRFAEVDEVMLHYVTAGEGPPDLIAGRLLAFFGEENG